MIDLLAPSLLALCFLVGLILVPLGLPGLWIVLGGVLLYGWLTDFQSVGVGLIAVEAGLAFAGELIEWWIGFRFAKRYGGSSRAGWGALVGGIVGAVIGVPVPVVGSVIGAFAGSFVGAVVFEYTASRRAETAVGAGWGAVLGRAAASAAKTALGLVMGVVTAFAILRS